MCAYNRLNGAFCSEHEWLLTRLLKQEWGFEGLVISDWGAVHDRIVAMAAAPAGAGRTHPALGQS